MKPFKIKLLVGAALFLAAILLWVYMSAVVGFLGFGVAVLVLLSALPSE